jgi:hypothetical protein
MTSDTDRIAKLEKELAALKAKQAPPPRDYEADRKATAEYADQVHQARERAANQFRFAPDIQRAMNAACGTNDLRDLVHASHRPQGPSAEAIPSSQTLTGVHAPGRGLGMNGWRDATPLGPQPGINHVDRVAAEFERRDRAELAKKLKGG